MPINLPKFLSITCIQLFKPFSECGYSCWYSAHIMVLFVHQVRAKKWKKICSYSGINILALILALLAVTSIRLIIISPSTIIINLFSSICIRIQNSAKYVLCHPLINHIYMTYLILFNIIFVTVFDILII